MSASTKRRRLLVVAVAIVLGGGVAFLWWRGRTRNSSMFGSAPPAPARVGPQLADPSAFAGLHAPDTAPRDDLRIVGAAVRNYLQSAPGPQAPPLGSNEEIVRALRGENPLQIAFIPPHHPAIDEQGELRDRWGTAYFFHPLSAEEIEIRSAGPDRRLFTGDDLLGSSAFE